MLKLRKPAKHLLVSATMLATLGWIAFSAYPSSQPLAPVALVRANHSNQEAPASCPNDSWSATSLTNAPEARYDHKAVWTGSEMIVWGGRGGSGAYLNTGARYNPSTDTWTPISTAGAPAGRDEFTAVWTGSEMIVWGGHISTELDTGGRYNPVTDTWTPISAINAPTKRRGHTAVWTGSEMIVWGGYSRNNGGYLNTGGRYNPATDTWTPTSTTDVPHGRDDHTVVWTGSEMIIWGGAYNGYIINSGGRYNPARDTWTATSYTNAPNGRYLHTAVWTGSEMIVWAGFGYDTQGATYLNTGGRYNPATDSWIQTSTTNAPSIRGYQSAVWSGNDMIVWSGWGAGGNINTGGRYDPATDSWRETSLSNAPDGRTDQATVWTGSELLVWGGRASGYFNTGGRYCAACIYSLSSAYQSFTPDGGSGSLNLTTSTGCSWSASSNASWLTITSPTSGSGNASISFHINENTSGASRSARLNIAGLSFPVYQGMRFGDVPSSHQFYTEIGKLSARDVTLGCGGGNFCPTDTVTREQMAVFIERALGVFDPPAPPSQTFGDVSPSRWSYAFIEDFARRGITQGCGGGNFCPEAPVTREQMAMFIIRALGMFNPPAPTEQRYLDVPPPRMGYSFIEQMAVRGITQGCNANPPMYCPDDSVTRGQMAAFLVRAFNL